MSENRPEDAVPPYGKKVPLYGRRQFIKIVVIGGSSLVLFGNKGCETEKKLQFIAVDYSKCIGCRTCETVCSAYNEKEEVDGELINGLGNPHYSRIRVTRYSPDVDVPTVCVNCPNPPCIQACPSPFDPVTGRKALYRDDETLAIKFDATLCEPCDLCYEACRDFATGILYLHKDTDQPMRICNLCDGDPQCVAYCPAEALTFVNVEDGMADELYGKSPHEIAKILAREWYFFEGD